MKKLALLAMSLVPLALAATPTPADACGGAIFQERFIAPKPTPPQLPISAGCSHVTPPIAMTSAEIDPISGQKLGGRI